MIKAPILFPRKLSVNRRKMYKTNTPKIKNLQPMFFLHSGNSNNCGNRNILTWVKGKAALDSAIEIPREITYNIAPNI